METDQYDIYDIPEKEVDEWANNNREKFNKYVKSNKKMVRDYIGTTISEEDMEDIKGEHLVLMYHSKTGDFVGRIEYAVLDNDKFKKEGIESYVYLFGMFVDDKYKGKGFCGKLLDRTFAIENRQTHYVLDVDIINRAAVKCYKKKGFKQMGRVKKGVMYMVKTLTEDELKDPEDVIVGGVKNSGIDYYEKYMKYKNKYLNLKLK